MDALTSAVPVEPGSADGSLRPTAIVLAGDCRVLMSGMDADLVDSIVTDPPYGLSREPDAVEVLTHWLAGDDYVHAGNGFMGNSWDSFVPGPAVWKEAYRVLKPGGFLLAFFGTRTYDLGAIAIRLAGFEVRDMVDWIYGSGFPKGGNRDGKGTCLKPAHEPIVMARKPFKGSVAANEARFGTGAINIDACRIHGDDAQGGTYTVKRLKPGATLEKTGGNWRPEEGGVEYHGEMKPGRWPANVIHDGSDDVVLAFPQAPGQQARSLSDGSPQGNSVYGKMLNAGPVHEPRDSGGSAARFFKSCSWEDSAWLDLNLPLVLASIVGNLLPLPKLFAAFAQSDAAISALPEGMQFHVVTAPSTSVTASECVRISALLIRAIQSSANGSWLAPQPDELTLTSSHVRLVAQQTLTGITMTMTGLSTSNGCAEAAIFSIMPKSVALGEPGCAEGFRYCAKASKADRDEGLDDFDPQAFVQFQTGNGESGKASSLSDGRETQYRNTHPTVKPTALMRYLVRLVTPIGGTVLDPFTGSGSTGKAAVLEGRCFIGCELTEAYVPIARARIAAAQVQADAEHAAANPPPPPQIDMFAEIAA